MKIVLIIKYYSVLLLSAILLLFFQILKSLLLLINTLKYNFVVAKNLFLYKSYKDQYLKKNINEKLLFLNYYFFKTTNINLHSIWLLCNKNISGHKKIFLGRKEYFWEQKNIFGHKRVVFGHQ